MISFLLSLFLVDRQWRQWRLSQHSQGSDSFWFRLTHRSWLRGPEPYQDSQDSTWKHSENAPAQSSPATTYPGWYTRKNHRAMAKMEVSDAFEMRRRVIFAIAVWALIGLLAITYGVRRMYGWVSRA